MVFEFLNELTQAGYRIFNIKDAREVAAAIGIEGQSLPYILRTLLAKKAIRSLFKGSYAIEDHILSGSPLHRFEIALHLAPGGMICCWSAMEFHELTDQILSNVYVYSPYQAYKPRSLYRYKIDGYNFQLIQTEKKNIWGFERGSIGERKVNIADLERTLIDGVMKPQYCGGFREVLNAFTLAKNRIDQNKLIGYAQQSSGVVKKRIGWILDQLLISIPEGKFDQSDYYDKLDPSAPRRGKYNKKWMVMENF